MVKKASTYMIKNVVSVNQEETLSTLMNTMNTNQVSHLLVNDSEEQLVGVISKEDILNKLKFLVKETTGKTYSSIFSNNIHARELMTKEFISVSLDDSLDYAVELLLQKEFHCLPVVQEGKAVGIISSYDLLKGYYQEFG